MRSDRLCSKVPVGFKAYEKMISSEEGYSSSSDSEPSYELRSRKGKRLRLAGERKKINFQLKRRKLKRKNMDSRKQKTSTTRLTTSTTSTTTTSTSTLSNQGSTSKTSELTTNGISSQRNPGKNFQPTQIDNFSNFNDNDRSKFSWDSLCSSQSNSFSFGNFSAPNRCEELKFVQNQHQKFSSIPKALEWITKHCGNSNISSKQGNSLACSEAIGDKLKMGAIDCLENGSPAILSGRKNHENEVNENVSDEAHINGKNNFNAMNEFEREQMVLVEKRNYIHPSVANLGGSFQQKDEATGLHNRDESNMNGEISFPPNEDEKNQTDEGDILMVTDAQMDFEISDIEQGSKQGEETDEDESESDRGFKRRGKRKQRDFETTPDTKKQAIKITMNNSGEATEEVQSNQVISEDEEIKDLREAKIKDALSYLPAQGEQYSMSIKDIAHSASKSLPMVRSKQLALRLNSCFCYAVRRYNSTNFLDEFINDKLPQVYENPKLPTDDGRIQSIFSQWLEEDQNARSAKSRIDDQDLRRKSLLPLPLMSLNPADIDNREFTSPCVITGKFLRVPESFTDEQLKTLINIIPKLSTMGTEKLDALLKLFE